MTQSFIGLVIYLSLNFIRYVRYHKYEFHQGHHRTSNQHLMVQVNLQNEMTNYHHRFPYQTLRMPLESLSYNRMSEVLHLPMMSMNVFLSYIIVDFDSIPY